MPGTCHRRGPAVLAALVLGAAGLSLGLPSVLSPSLSHAQSDTTRVDPTTVEHARALSHAFQQVSRAVAPAVVNITSVQEIARASAPQDLPPQMEDFFRRFFGEDELRQFDMPQGPIERPSQGSGVIVSEDGYIITNNHVVENASSITVRLSDQRSFDAEVVGTDPDTDLAVIKIDGSGLTVAALGDSDAAEVGEWVLAIGNPFGLDRTVTAGIISAKGRDVGILGPSGFEDFIQTDAAINPGNSGGPLVNLNGEVIGINTLIQTTTGFYQGVGMAIPSAMVRDVYEAIVEEGRVQRGFLGVIIQPLDEDLAQTFNYPSTEGAVIADVTPGGPADQAGLKAEDIVVEINGGKVEDVRDLQTRIAAMEPGATVELTVFRGGEREQIEVTLGERPTTSQVAQRPQEAQNTFGLTVQPLTESLAERLGLNAGEGVVVTNVERGSVAASAGIRPGTVILRVNDTRVNSIEEYQQAMRDADPERGVRLHVQRGEAAGFIVLKSPDDE